MEIETRAGEENYLVSPETAITKAQEEDRIRETESIFTETNKKIAELYPDAFMHVESDEKGINREYWILKKSLAESDSKTEIVLTPRGIVKMENSASLADIPVLDKAKAVVEHFTDPGVVRLIGKTTIRIYDMNLAIDAKLENPFDDKLDIESYKKRFAEIQEQRKNDSKVIDTAVERWK